MADSRNVPVRPKDEASGVADRLGVLDQLVLRAHFVVDSASGPKPRWFRSRSAVPVAAAVQSADFYNLDTGGGSKSDLHHLSVKSRNFVSGMRGSAPRFRGHGGQDLGLFVSTADHCGPGHYVGVSQWTEPRSPEPRKSPTSPKLQSPQPAGAMFRSTSSRMAPVARGFDTDFPNLDSAGGSKMDFANAASRRSNSGAMMRAETSARFRYPGKTHVGPGAYLGNRPWSTPGQQQTKDLREGDRHHSSPLGATTPARRAKAGSDGGDAIFRSSSSRIPEGKDSWIILRERSSEPGSISPELDSMLWRKQPYSGQVRGPGFGIAKRFTGPPVPVNVSV